MKKALKYFSVSFALSLALGLILAFSARIAQYEKAPVIIKQGVVMDVMDETLVDYAPAWSQEVSRRFPDAVVVLCHGGEIEEGRWVLKTSWNHAETAVSVIEREHAKWPLRTVVVLGCNPDHVHLTGLPYAYQADDYVYCIPDRALTPSEEADGASKMVLEGRNSVYPNAVGNIFEFQECN
jgi:hypothetical protein